MTASLSPHSDEHAVHVSPLFRAFPTFRPLNIAAVGLSLGAIVSLPAAITVPSDEAACAVALGLPTALLGGVWARFLRSPRAGGWAASIPLAWLNSTVIGALGPVLGPTSYDPWPLSAIFGALIGATIGVIVWVPALLATLLLFGVPIAYARRRAGSGVSVAERGEGVLGLATGVIGLVAFVAAVVSARDVARGLFTCALGFAGAAAGGSAAVLALARELGRGRFVKSVEAGGVPGYYVEARPEGRSLMRTPTESHAYRDGAVLVAVLPAARASGG
jgi:hypothetical protein